MGALGASYKRRLNQKTKTMALIYRWCSDAKVSMMAQQQRNPVWSLVRFTVASFHNTVTWCKCASLSCNVVKKKLKKETGGDHHKWLRKTADSEEEGGDIFPADEPKPTAEHQGGFQSPVTSYNKTSPNYKKVKGVTMCKEKLSYLSCFSFTNVFSKICKKPFTATD